MGGERHDVPSEADFNYDLDGQAFVPQALPNNADDNRNRNGNTNLTNRTDIPASSLHPQHVQRTEELRAHAAAVRQQQALESQGESFPKLQSASTSASAPRVGGWTAGTSFQTATRSNRNVGQVTQEAFPALQSESSSNRKKKAATEGSIGATRRQFAAITITANQQQQQQHGSLRNSQSAASIGSMAPTSMTGRSNNYSASAPGAAVAHQINRQSNLSPNNFPSLGGPSSSDRGNNNRSVPAYSAANALEKKMSQGKNTTSFPPLYSSSATKFPPMQSSQKVAATTSSAKATKSNAKPPSINSVSDFPPPPSASRSNKKAARQQSEQARSNASHTGLSSAAKATVEDMKASLGPKDFKQLKRLTKDFAQEQLSPEGYVDQAASLFERGYADQDFWSYLPSLLESCPNEDAAQHALDYMNSLKRQQHSLIKTTQFAPTTAAAQWSGITSNEPNSMRQVVTPPLTTGYSVAHRLSQPVAGHPQTISSKKKSAWGLGGKATIARAKAPPGSVAAAAASQDPQGGSATKYMAKQEKKKQKSTNISLQQTNTKNNGTKKKKQKNELRELAFGR